MILGLIKQVWQSLRWEDTSQYRRLFFAGWKIEHDGMWWHGAKHKEKCKEAIDRIADSIFKEIMKDEQ